MVVSKKAICQPGWRKLDAGWKAGLKLRCPASVGGMSNARLARRELRVGSWQEC